MARKTAILKSLAREWTPFEQVPITDEMRKEHKLLRNCTSIFANSRFEVQLFAVETSIGGVMQMTIARHGQIEDATWEEIQRIVHEIFGPECVAVEIYPAYEHEWQTNTRVRIVWVLPSTYGLPFGLEKPGAWGVKNG